MSKELEEEINGLIQELCRLYINNNDEEYKFCNYFLKPKMLKWFEYAKKNNDAKKNNVLRIDNYYEQLEKLKKFYKNYTYK